MFEKLHEQIVIAASEIKDRLADCENINNMTFEIDVSGRVTGELKLEYKLGQYGCDVKGANLEAVLTEYMRRMGWKKNNDPIAIPYMKKVIGESVEYVPIAPTEEY